MHEQVARIQQWKAQHRWTMTQKWEHLFFLHWMVPRDVVRPLVPEPLEVDTFGGKAWIGIILFKMHHFKLRYIPMPYPFSFPEINLRTYVKANGYPAIFFVTLDAADPWVVHVAKRWYRLPYYQADIHFKHEGDTFQFHSRRRKREPVERFRGEFTPVSSGFPPSQGTVEHWLTERYTFFSQPSGHRHIYRGDIYHEPWTLQTARGRIDVNTMLQSYDIALPRTPDYVHYAKGVKAIIGPLRTYT